MKCRISKDNGSRMRRLTLKKMTDLQKRGIGVEDRNERVLG